MKRTLFALLTISLLMGLVLPAHAVEVDTDVAAQEQQEETQVQEPQEPTQDEQQPEDQQEPQDSLVVVSTLEELQTAIEAAEDGDTIVLSNCININSSEQDVESITIGNKEKTITLIPADSFQDQSLLYLCHVNGNITFENIIMDGRFSEITAIDSSYLPSEAQTNVFLSSMTIKNFNNRAGIFLFGNIQMNGCSFEKNSTYSNGGQLFFRYDAIVKMTDCVIKNGNCTGSGAGIYNNGSLEMYNCEIRNNIAANGTGSASNAGGIYNCGTCYIEDSYIVENIADVFGGINNSGTLTIKDSLIYNNIGKMGVNDLFGRATITYSEKYNWQGRTPSGWYDDSENNRFNGEDNITEFYGLNLTDVANLRLVFVFEDEIAVKTDPQPTPDINTNDPTPTPDDENQSDKVPDTGSDTKPEPTTPEPSTPTDKDDPANTPQEPTKPPEGEGKDDPAVTPPEATEPPTVPPQDKPKDDPTVTPTTTPDTPQQPTDSGDSEDDDYTPPVSHRPAHKPSTPIAMPVKPTPTTEPEDKPKLSCGGAVIDTSRTIVLLGYGDGLQHEEDPLTRAQLATIVFRLLDDESIALYSNAVLAFTDVPADAWYAPYVQTINGAGIVYGVGGGHYDPEGVVSWAQILTILSRFVESQQYALQHIQYDGWAQEAVQTAVALGWIEDSADFNPDSIISRGELVQLVNRVLELNR